MKLNRFTFIFALLVTLFISCAKEEVVYDPYGQPEDNQSYTVMMYGCGGGNLDTYMMQNIEEACLAGASDRVKFTGLINFSKSIQDSIESVRGTHRFIIGSTPGADFAPEKISDEPLFLGDPNNLTEFINWSKQVCPSDQYVLLLWNHGAGWTPKHDEPQTRAIIYDDNHDDKALTLNNLVKGIDDSGTHFKMIYFDACLMGTMEVITGVKGHADYVMGASHITPGLGGDYNSLIYHLGTKVNFENSMIEYCIETMSHWNTTGMALDLKLINLNKIDKFLGEIKVFAGYLNEITNEMKVFENEYNNSNIDTTSVEFKNMINLYEAFNKSINNCYKYDNTGYPFYDLLNFAELLTGFSGTTYSAKFVDIASRLNRSWNEAVVFNNLSTAIRFLDLSVAVTIVNEEEWKNLHYDTAYDNLLFDQITDWGAWLSKNPIPTPTNPGAEGE